jgi:osmotically-inducible protein OsmY
MKIKTLVFMLLSASLTGCVVAVVAGAASSLVVYDKRTIAMVEKDARIFHRIHTAIVPDPRFRDSRIVISSFNEVVLLAGQTPIASLRAVAEKQAQETPNVHRVYNEITVDYPISLSQQSQDTWETSQVRTQMLAQKGLESGSIRVITENSVVYLMGAVTPEQADLAVHVARQVKGVRKVVKIFQYIR